MIIVVEWKSQFDGKSSRNVSSNERTLSGEKKLTFINSIETTRLVKQIEFCGVFIIFDQTLLSP